MLFNSLHFFIFLPLFVGMYYLLPHKFRWVLLFLGSCYFYMVFVPKYILILFFIILLDYFMGLVIEKKQGFSRKLYLIISIAANVLLLGFFKYYNFFDENIAKMLTKFGMEYHTHHLDLVLPIGLSFHTFQSMSYTIEVYRGNQKAERHLGYFANYVLFFPQMVAGPIERYSSLGNSLKTEQKFTYSNFIDGMRLILFGLFIKMSVADNLAVYVDSVYWAQDKFNSVQIVTAMFFFSFQIYADFYGYSTIAQGCAKLMGINLMDNFKTPYLSKSVNEFWQRWHISLSSWFRDYLYIPLGGNRVKLPVWCLNILIVFMVSGLWHGARWNFVIWGMLHGITILLERAFSAVFKFKIKEGWSFLNVLLTLKTFILVTFYWMFFRSEYVGNVKSMLHSIFYNQNYYWNELSLVFGSILCLMLLLSDILVYNSRFDIKFNSYKPALRWSFYAVLFFGLLALSSVQKHTFIYFQF
jgi:alginate O-acetyltransferase complex protein AlgI